MGDIAKKGNRLTKKVPGELRALLKGVRKGRPLRNLHTRDVPTMAQGGGRIAGPARRAQESGFYSPDMGMRGKFGYKHGGRTKKVVGGLLRLVPKIIKKIIKKKPRHKDLDVPGSKGPQIGKYPGIDKAMENIKKSGDIWGPGKAKGGRIGFRQGKIASPRQQRLSRRARLEKKKESIKDLIVKQKEEKKDYKPKSYLEKDTEKQAKTSELMKYGMPKKYKPFPQHMDWKTGPVKSDAYKKRVSDVADIHIAHGGEGFKKGGKADKKWIQKATKGMVKTKPCTGKKFGSKSCPPGSRRYNLAKTFKKMGRERKAKG